MLQHYEHYVRLPPHEDQTNLDPHVLIVAGSFYLKWEFEWLVPLHWLRVCRDDEMAGSRTLVLIECPPCKRFHRSIAKARRQWRDYRGESDVIVLESD